MEVFRQGIAQSEQEHRTSKLHPKLQRTQADALRSQLQSVERELREYEELKSGRHRVLTYASFDELPKALVQARIARGWTQKDLADRLGLDEQKIQDLRGDGLSTGEPRAAQRSGPRAGNRNPRKSDAVNVSPPP